MPQLFQKLTVLLAFSVFTITNSYCQLSFPKGKSIDTVIHVDLAYDETRIFFNTGKYKSSDYLYEKVSDSLHPNWFVTACYNGDCHNELEQSGKFISTYGINDTTCFIAFHVESYGFNGQSTIRYNIINSINADDKALVEIKVTYLYTTGAKEIKKVDDEFKIWANPGTKSLMIKAKNREDFQVRIINLQGKSVLQHTFSQTEDARLNTNLLAKGLYLIEVKTKENTSTQKVIID